MDPNNSYYNDKGQKRTGNDLFSILTLPSSLSSCVRCDPSRMLSLGLLTLLLNSLKPSPLGKADMHMASPWVPGTRVKPS